MSEINWPVCSVTADMNVVLEQETDDGETNSFLSSFVEWDKVIHPKYSKHWLTTVAHTIDCECSKILL